mgnify:FL=1
MNVFDDFELDTDETIAELASDLPDDMRGLIFQAQIASDQYASAIEAEDLEMARASLASLQATIYKANGNTMFGCAVNEAVQPIYDALKAEPGTIPHWGQCGEFIVQIESVRAICSFTSKIRISPPNFAFYVIDKHQLFISPTGFHSAYTYEMSGTVEDRARLILAELADAQLVSLEADAFGHRRELPEWAADQLADTPRPIVSDAHGQVQLPF